MIVFTKHAEEKFKVLKRHKFMKKQYPKISYEPEADVLMWEVSDKPIDHAKEIGNVVIHFDKENNPVLIEILEANDFLNKAKKLVFKSPYVPKANFAIAHK